MSKVNSKLVQMASVLRNPLTFQSTTGMAAAAMAPANAANIQLLINLVSWEETNPTEHRLFLDEMSPQCRTSLFRILTDMKAASIV